MRYGVMAGTMVVAALMAAAPAAHAATFEVAIVGFETYKVTTKGNYTTNSASCRIEEKQNITYRADFNTSLRSSPVVRTQGSGPDRELVPDELPVRVSNKSRSAPFFDHTPEADGCGEDYRPRAQTCSHRNVPGELTLRGNTAVEKGPDGDDLFVPSDRLTLSGTIANGRKECFRPPLKAPQGPHPDYPANQWYRYRYFLPNASSKEGLGRLDKARKGQTVFLRADRKVTDRGPLVGGGTWTAKWRVYWTAAFERVR